VDFPQTGIPPLFINSMSRYAARCSVSQAQPATSALTWTANQAQYIPFYLPWPYPVRRVFWSNGSSVVSTNVDVGIYTADGTRIYSTGSTAASGASVLQYVTPTEFLLSPGRYYMAKSCSTATAARGGTGQSSMTLGFLQMAGFLEEASALPLPATMTPVTATLTVIPIYGFTQTASGF
jgi:hypothetical protein